MALLTTQMNELQCMKILRLRKGKFNIIYIIGRKILFCSLCGKKAAL